MGGDQNNERNLFNRDIKTIGKHIANALREECQNSVVAKFATTADDGKIYQVEHYDLDLILSLKGYSLNHRMLAAGMQVESRFQEQEKSLPP